MLLLLHPVFYSQHTLGSPRREQVTLKCLMRSTWHCGAQVYQEKLIDTFILLDFPQNSYLYLRVVDSDVCLYMKMLDLASCKTPVLSIIYLFLYQFPTYNSILKHLGKAWLKVMSIPQERNGQLFMATPLSYESLREQDHGTLTL